jgi:hypothetical protein
VREEEIESEESTVQGRRAEAAGVIGRDGRAARRFAILAALAVTALLVLGAGSAGAATIVVERTEDVTNGSFDDLGCTLRDAVDSANQNKTIANGCNGDNAGADTIVLEGGKSYNLSLHAVDDDNAKGDLDITGPVTIRSAGPGLATIDAVSNIFPGPAVGADRAIDVKQSAGTVTLEGVRIESGFVDGAATTGNGGGGMRNEATLNVIDSEVVANKVRGSGQVLGGGIYSRGSLANLAIVGSTIAENEAVQLGTDIESQAIGGGIASWQGSKTLTITNSTIAANKVTAGNANANNGAGGVFGGDNPDHPVSTYTNVTIVNNTATGRDGGGGIWIPEGTLTNTVIAGNTDPPYNASPECLGGTFPSGGGNVLGTPEVFSGEEYFCGMDAATDVHGTRAAPINPNLGTLVDNGGLTRTMVPNPGSPLIDRGANCPATDQRGFFRVAAPPCDSGAVEVGATATPPAAPPSPPPADNGSSSPPPSGSTAAASTTVPTLAPPALQSTRTGKRAAALAKCAKKKTARQRAKCRAKARKLPV